MADYSFRWDEDSLTPQVHGIDNAVHAFLAAAVSYHAPGAESYAKRNASWQDQTSNARNGLFAAPEITRGNYKIVVGHGVPYGIWLEVRFAGRYAILEKTIAHEGKELMKTVQQGLMDAVVRG